jgi:hypothetical protein
VPAFRPVVSSPPPSEPDLRLPPHPALHEHIERLPARAASVVSEVPAPRVRQRRAGVRRRPPSIQSCCVLTGPLRPVDGFPALRLLRRLCPHRECSRPVPVSLTAPPAGFPGSTAVTFSGSRRSLSTTWGLASASPGHRNSSPVREEEARTDCEDNPPGPRREPLTSRSLLGDYASQRSYAYPRLEA